PHVPFHGVANSLAEANLSCPPQLLLHERGIDCISAVVARSVGNKSSQVEVVGNSAARQCRIVLWRQQMVERSTHFRYYLEVCPLTSSANVVFQADSAVL